MNAEMPLSSQDYTLLAADGYSLYPMHDSLRLLDAHLIFEPLLSSLGVMPQQMITNTGCMCFISIRVCLGGRCVWCGLK